MKKRRMFAQRACQQSVRYKVQINSKYDGILDDQRSKLIQKKKKKTFDNTYPTPSTPITVTDNHPNGTSSSFFSLGSMVAYQVTSPRKKKTQRGGYAAPRLVSQIAPSSRASYRRTTHQAERLRKAKTDPIVDKMLEYVQYLRRNKVPSVKWGERMHILADSFKDKELDSGDTGFDGDGFYCDEGSTETRQCRRMDYGRFNWANASSLDTEDENDSEDEMERPSSTAPSLDDILRRPQMKAPRFGVTEARRKTQNKLEHWSDFIASVTEKAVSGSETQCSCVKRVVSLPAISLNGM
jgi:hypothetical protein